MELLRLRGFPWAAVLLAAALLAVYLLLSGETPYIPSDQLYTLSTSLGNPLTLLSYVFVHVGIYHLAGKLRPLALCALVLESVLPSRHVVLLFLFSGAAAGIAFALTNPFITLIGASAGISGMMGAAMILRPKQSLVLLLALPLVVPLAVMPGIAAASSYYDSILSNERQSLQTSLVQAVNESRFNNSAALQQKISALNQSLAKTEKKIAQTKSGAAREEAVPTDLLVHFYGVVAGVLYVFLFRRRDMMDSKEEFIGLGDLLRSLPSRLAGRKKRRGR
ncbi:MAG: rhomboid family intramembrane serine protease [Candidatus Micrarchaeota archaeon]